MAVQTQIQVRRGTASSWTSTNPTLAAGEIGFESDTGKIKVGTGSATWNSLTYIGAANAIQYVYNASAGQTTFSGADANGATLSYTVGAEQVYVNGVLQVRGTDYTATNGTSVVLTTATIASDIVTIIAYGTFSVADTYTQAQANATFPLNTSAFFAGKNKIINGDFGIWQRGTSFTSVDSQFTADRFRSYVNGSGATHTISRQTFTAGTAPVAGYEGKYFLRWNQSVAGSGATYKTLEQPIEDVQTLAGQTATFSFWAKGDSNATISGTLTQVFGSGGSSDVNTSLGNFNITTSWTRFSVTVAIPSIAGKTIGTGSNIYFRLNLPLNTTYIFDIWGQQVEAGSVATAFQTATGTIQGELAACQRYYEKNAGTIIMTTANGGLANSYASSYGYQVTKRTTPTLTVYSGADQSGTSGQATWYAGGTGTAATADQEANQITFFTLRRTGTSTNTLVSFSFTASAEL